MVIFRKKIKMKFTIITPIYNEENLIENYFSNILNLNYNLNNIEIIFVNDGSTDKSKIILEKIQKKYKNKFSGIKIFNNKNTGRSYTRFFGAKNSKFTNLILLDVKCLIEKDSIKNLEKHIKEYECIVGNIENKFYKNNISSRIFYLFHKKFYSKFSNFEKIQIDENNFDDVPKGTTLMFCKKKMFLKSQLKDIYNKNSSDDTKLLKNILLNSKKRKILKLEKFLGVYYPRKKIYEEIKHIFQRGPKFVDYYFYRKRKYFIHILILIFSTIFISISLLFNFKLIFLYFSIFILLNFLISIFLSENLKDFFNCFIFCPIFIFFFLLGIIKGLILKIRNKKKIL